MTVSAAFQIMESCHHDWLFQHYLWYMKLSFALLSETMTTFPHQSFLSCPIKNGYFNSERSVYADCTNFVHAFQEGKPINCPLRCTEPRQVVINFSARQMVKMNALQHFEGRTHAPNTQTMLCHLTKVMQISKRYPDLKTAVISSAELVCWQS